MSIGRAEVARVKTGVSKTGLISLKKTQKKTTNSFTRFLKSVEIKKKKTMEEKMLAPKDETSKIKSLTIYGQSGGQNPPHATIRYKLSIQFSSHSFCLLFSLPSLSVV